MRSRYSNARLLILITFSLLFCDSVSAQINVTAGQTAQALAQKLAGQGVTLFNATLNCATQANGFFTVTSSNLGLDSGIVLTNGRAATQGSNYGVNGPSSYFASTDDGRPGDPMLDSLAGQSTVDACSLEFDVIPNGDTLKFSYVFSSEEYKSAVCGSYNDAFAFFISGPGISGSVNMALVPGTSIPVTINTINDSIPSPGKSIAACAIMGPGSPFSSYYIDNSAGTTLTHLGLTTVLQAIHGVTPCGTYHLKLVIADAGDPLYDSGVFLEAGSLETESYNVRSISSVPADTSSLPFCIKGCLPGHFRVRRSIPGSQPQTVKLLTGGSAVSGVDYSPIPDSVIIPANDTVTDLTIHGLPTFPYGPKTMELYILSPYSCNGINNVADSASLVIYDTLHVSIVTPDTFICANDSTLLQVNGSDLLNYNWSPATALSNANTKDPIAFPSASTLYTVTATLPGSACPALTASVYFAIRLTPFIQLNQDTTICYNAQINLDANVTEPNAYYSYKWTGPNSFTSTQLNPAISNVSGDNTGLYTLSITNDTNTCKGIASVYINVNVPDTPTVVSPQIFCLDKPAFALKVTGVNLLWYDAAHDTATTEAPVIVTSGLGAYTYYVTQTIGNCESPKVPVDVEVKKCCDGNIFIPSAFTPNNDGRNDKFETIVDYGYYIQNMYIFNRWGQVIYSGVQGIWDGKFGGQPVETGTYFYLINFGCILGGTVEKKGDVTLLR